MLPTPQVRYLVRQIGKRSITNLTSDFVHPEPSKRLQAVRGGQNLSERFKWLEDSLRRKDTITKQVFLATKGNQIDLPAISTAHTQAFHGFHVPQEPIPPADEGMFNVL